MMARSITAAELRGRYQAGGEIAIVDAREEGSLSRAASADGVVPAVVAGSN